MVYNETYSVILKIYFVDMIDLKQINIFNTRPNVQYYAEFLENISGMSFLHSVSVLNAAFLIVRVHMYYEKSINVL